MFSELRSKKIAAASPDREVAASHNSVTSVRSLAPGGPAAESPTESVFTSADDRQLLLAVLLHCADIGNSVMPFDMAEW